MKFTKIFLFILIFGMPAASMFVPTKYTKSKLHKNTKLRKLRKINYSKNHLKSFDKINLKSVSSSLYNKRQQFIFDIRGKTTPYKIIDDNLFSILNSYFERSPGEEFNDDYHEYDNLYKKLANIDTLLLAGKRIENLWLATKADIAYARIVPGCEFLIIHAPEEEYFKFYLSHKDGYGGNKENFLTIISKKHPPKFYQVHHDFMDDRKENLSNLKIFSTENTELLKIINNNIVNAMIINYTRYSTTY